MFTVPWELSGGVDAGFQWFPPVAHIWALLWVLDPLSQVLRDGAQMGRCGCVHRLWGMCTPTVHGHWLG